ncbi:MAG: folate-binding protein YgfZ [Kangiellaceae bacterium]|nr:folate-binding protein YgfZ [Kangiellaceae bacterium]
MNLTNKHALEHINSLQNIACELSHYGVVKVSGDDAVKLLQGQTSCDIHKLDSANASLGAMCNVQGRIHAIFYIVHWRDGYFLIMPHEVIEHFISRLSMYAVFFKAEITNVSEEFQLWGSCKKSETPEDSPESSMLAVTTQDNGLELHLHSLFNASIHLIPTQHVNQLDNLLSESTLADHKSWDYVEIQARIPMIYQNTIEQLLPHFIGLDMVGGISFDKGCYTGQEIIARMHYRGKLKTHACLAWTTGEKTIQPNSKLINQDNKTVGEVVRSAPYAGKTYCLISLADKALDQPVFIEHSQADHLPIELISQ